MGKLVAQATGTGESISAGDHRRGGGHAAGRDAADERAERDMPGLMEGGWREGELAPRTGLERGSPELGSVLAQPGALVQGLVQRGHRGARAGRASDQLAAGR